MKMELLYERYRKSTGICTDTRKIQSGCFFVALKGEHFNGNRFAAKALESGASAALVDEVPPVHDERFIQVPDALYAFQDLAQHHRRQHKAKVIAIGGSNGKTTTRELITRILATKFQTVATLGNLNNHIGVPLSLFSIQPHHEFAVIELGANHLGETKRLCEIAEPDFGIITNNGKDHLEGYGSIDNVRKGNGELADFLRSRKGTVFVSDQQPDLLQASEQLKRVTYGSLSTSNCPGRITATFPFLTIELPGLNLETRLLGNYNFENVMAAVCVGSYFGVPDTLIRAAITSYNPANNRSQLVQRDKNYFILDAYNANPSSMEAALENLAGMPVPCKVLILGDMAELGSASTEEHRLVVEKIKRNTWEKVILVGPEFRKAAAGSDLDFKLFESVDELRPWFSRQSFSGCYFLLKASRVIGLERLLE